MLLLVKYAPRPSMVDVRPIRAREIFASKLLRTSVKLSERTDLMQRVSSKIETHSVTLRSAPRSSDKCLTLLASRLMKRRLTLSHLFTETKITQSGTLISSATPTASSTSLTETPLVPNQHSVTDLLISMVSRIILPLCKRLSKLLKRIVFVFSSSSRITIPSARVTCLAKNSEVFSIVRDSTLPPLNTKDLRSILLCHPMLVSSTTWT